MINDLMLVTPKTLTTTKGKFKDKYFFNTQLANR